MRTLLRQARQKKGITTRELASALDIDQALISKFENGQRSPTRKQITQLAEILDIDFETLLVAWLKQKILDVISGEAVGSQALLAAQNELDPTNKPSVPDESLQRLLDEMDALKHKFENLRKM